MIYREPYGVALIIGPFNGPLLLLIRPALAALAAGNTCILTLSEALPATTEVLLDLVPKYFDPSAVTVVPGGKETNTELLKLPLRLHLLHRQHLCRQDRRAGGRGKPHAGPARTRRDEPGASWTRPPTFPTRRRRSSGARWPGAANGAPRQATPMSTSPSRTPSSPRPRRR